VTQSTVTSRTIAIVHIKIESEKKFWEVRRALEETIPKLNPAVGKFLRKGDQERAKVEEEHGPKLSIFLVRDHGALLQIAGGARNARQYDIGNPLTASKMTRHQLPAALYAPAARRSLRRRQRQRDIRIRQAFILLRAVRRRACDRGWTLPR
jgi:hypothetical protein